MSVAIGQLEDGAALSYELRPGVPGLSPIELPRGAAAGKVHFDGLNSLRFFAAVSGVLWHVELTKSYLHVQPNAAHVFDRINFGGLGVVLFFVLSGFLITYLLLVEKRSHRRISLRDFYIRRILRIWPLYFVTIGIGFFVLPAFRFFSLGGAHSSAPLGSDLALYLAMLPNVAFAAHGPKAHIEQTWSIGVEEHFYIFWPLVMSFSTKVRTILALITVCLLAKASVVAWGLTVGSSDAYQIVKHVFGMSKFESMMIGSLGAVILFERRRKLLRLIYHPASQILALVTFPFLSYAVGLDNALQDVVYLPVSVLFLVIIMNVASNPDSLVTMDIGWVDRLGRISYGIYMYHVMIVFIVVKLLRGSFAAHPIASNAIAYGASIGVSCLVAHLSYRYFEEYFMRLKSRFARVQAG